MLNVSCGINSLSNFKRNTSDFIHQLKETKAPIVLTVNGVSEPIVQSAEGYQALLDRLDYLEAVAGIRLGLQEIAEGKGQPVLEALESIRTKLSLPPSA